MKLKKKKNWSGEGAAKKYRINRDINQELNNWNNQALFEPSF